MSEWMGQVTKVNERDWGTKKVFSWQFAGTNLWFRIEADEAPVEKGECYRVSGESANKITLIEKAEPEAVKDAAKEETGGVPPASSPDYWRWKQMTDIEQRESYEIRAARADATRLVCAALEQDILVLGTAKGKKLDVLIGMINTTTQQMMEISNGTDD